MFTDILSSLSSVRMSPFISHVSVSLWHMRSFLVKKLSVKNPFGGFPFAFPAVTLTALIQKVCALSVTQHASDVSSEVALLCSAPLS